MGYWKEKSEYQEKQIQDLKSKLSQPVTPLGLVSMPVSCSHCKTFEPWVAQCNKKHGFLKSRLLCKACSKICKKCKKIYCPAHIKDHQCIKN